MAAEPDDIRTTTDPSETTLAARVMLYPSVYVWYVFLASLDLMLTWIILHTEGRELNLVAEKVIHRYDLPGLVVYKLALVMIVVCVCEIVGRRRRETGRRLAEWSVAITLIPVIVSFVLLIYRLVATTPTAAPAI